MSTGNSTLLMSRVAFGRALRRLRDDKCGLTLAEVAASLKCDLSLLSRIEHGKRVCSPRHFAQLLELYEVSTEEREQLTELYAAARERRKPWWSRYDEFITAQYERFLGFEAAAAVVHEYQMVMVPGLLQTERYARAATSTGFLSLGPDQIDGLVEVRALRQRHRLLETSDPMACHYVITQAALEFKVGGQEAHTEQLQQLLDFSEHPSVDLRAIPYEGGADGTQTGAFRIFQYADEDVPDVAFGESVAGSVTLDDPRDLRRLHRLFRSLSGAALSPAATRDLIARVKDEES